jgi:AcrR family transcriptional regulator
METPSQPKRPSADATRKNILKAARYFFAKKGFAGSSISEIAQKAKINQSLIYHHFENKQGLWKAVKIEALEQFRAFKGMDFYAIMAKESFPEFVESLIEYRFELYDQHPDLRRMLDWQSLDPSSEELRGLTPEKLQALRSRIHFFQESQQILPDYDVDLVITFILHAPVGFFKGYKDLKCNLKKDELRSYKQQYMEMCARSVIKGLS